MDLDWRWRNAELDDEMVVGVGHNMAAAPELPMKT